MSDRLEDLTLLSISLANEAVKESGKNIMIAGSLPPWRQVIGLTLFKILQKCRSIW